MAGPANSINEVTTGITGFTSTAFVGTPVTQFAVLVGGATSSTISNIAATANTGAILQNNSGANPSYSTATYPSTTTINQVLYSSAANTVAGITAANNGVMISGTTGVPSWLAAGTTGQALIATTGSPPSWGTVSSGDVVGPASSTDNAVVRFDGTTGKLIQNSASILDDSSNLSGINNLVINAGGAVQTSTVAGNTLLFQAYDTDTGPAYVTYMTLTAGTSPTLLIRPQDGVAGTPPYSFASETNMGFFRASSNQMGWSVLGAQFISMTNTAFQSATSNQWYLAYSGGAVGTPTYSFVGDTNNGWYRSAADEQSWSCNGVQQLTLSVNTLNMRKGQVVNLTNTAISYSVLVTDYIVAVTDNSAARTITLPTTAVTGQVFHVKDAAGTAQSSNNITITVSGGVKTIDGGTTYLINTNYGSVQLYYDGTNYFVI